MLEFNDDKNWLNRRIFGVKKAYIIPEILNKNSVAVDIGANVGAFPVVNSKNFSNILCFEPAKETYLKCCDTVFNLDNVKVYNLAVSSKSDEIVKLRYYKDTLSSGDATTLDDSFWYKDNGEYEEVKTISLEDIFTRFDIKKIDYLKVDCEGAEYDFLMNKNLSNIDYIGIEIHIHLANKANDLMNYIENTHEIISKLGDGKKMHFEITYKNKLI